MVISFMNAIRYFDIDLEFLDQLDVMLLCVFLQKFQTLWTHLLSIVSRCITIIVLDVDIDLWVQAPDDIPVGYSNKGGLFFNLLRDDLGIYKDNSPVNYEVSYSRGISKGNYIANVHLYREDKSPFIPIIAELLISVVDPDTNKRRQILKTSKKLEIIGKEITVFQFELDKKGKLNKNSINNNYVMLRSGNKDSVDETNTEENTN